MIVYSTHFFYSGGTALPYCLVVNSLILLHIIHVFVVDDIF